MNKHKRILQIIQDAFDNSYVIEDYWDVIDDAPLTQEEKEWAKENVGCRVVVTEI